jgi:hypothetical protein
MRWRQTARMYEGKQPGEEFGCISLASIEVFHVEQLQVPGLRGTERCLLTVCERYRDCRSCDCFSFLRTSPCRTVFLGADYGSFVVKPSLCFCWFGLAIWP